MSPTSIAGIQLRPPRRTPKAPGDSRICLIRDHQGAVVPIDDELATMIAAQQERTRQRFPTTVVLLPRSSANPDGRLSIPTATFHRQLGLWLENICVTDNLGHPAYVTAHQFRHSHATRLINLTCRRKWFGACPTTPAKP